MRTWMPFALAVALALPLVADDATPESLFHEGWYKETGLKDMEGAIASYEQVVARSKEAEAYAARAQYQIGVCLEKMGKAAEAKAAFEKVAAAYPDQKEWVEKANEKLAGEAETPRGEDHATEAVLRKMTATRISLNFVEAPLADVLMFYREFSGINMILDAEVSKPEEKMITFRVDELPFDQALDLTLKMVDLDWCVDEGVIVVSTKDGIAKRAESRKKPVESDADAAAWKAEMQRVLENTRIDLDFTDASLEDIIGFLREFSRINIEIDQKVREDGTAEKKITFQLRDMPLKSTLKLLLDQYELTYELVNHVLLIRRDESPR